MSIIKNSAKFFVQCLATMVAFVGRRPLTPMVMMYHSFDTAGWRYGTDPKELDWQLQYLKRKRQIVSLGDIVEYVAGKKSLPPTAVAITIDDGYEDTYRVFFPLATSLQIPFTIFLTTDLTKKAQLGFLERPTLAMLHEMYDSGLMTFGLHGHSHEHFTKALENGRAEEEIDASLQWIQSEFGASVTTVAYPSGQYNRAVLSYVAALPSIVAGFTARAGFVAVGDNPLTLSRVESHRRIPRWLFVVRLTRGFPLYNQLVNKIKPYVA
jgi:peptidoglycan/xylan/chitin deacetylase (PgdA/CDA1 family)